MMTDTELVLVVDRSGSMASIASDASGGINNLLREQRGVEGNCFVTLTQFDSIYEIVHDRVEVRSVPNYELRPRSMTALLDAVGRTIEYVMERRCERCDTDKRVVFVIVTDGHENSSKEFSLDRVRGLIDVQKKAGWEFVFLGANLDAFQAAGRLGITHADTLQYTASSIGMRSSYAAVSSNLTSVRTGASRTMAFTGEQRDSAAQDDGDEA